MLAALLALSLTQAPDAVTLRAVGDVMLGTSEPEGYLPADGGMGVLAAVAPLLAEAELTFMNLEGPICDHGATTKCKKPGRTCYAFRTPTSYAQHLAAAGLDLASTANNHAGDFGDVCRRETEQALDALGVTWSGPAGTVGTRTVHGKKLALIAFHTSASCNDVNDLPAAVKRVKDAKATHDLVIVSFHGGKEGTDATRVPQGSERFLGENRGDLRAFTHAVIDAGAALVLGHGPHVLRGMEVYRGHLIAYSLGNFATYGRFDLSGPLAVAVILEARLSLTDGAFLGGRLISTRQHGKGIPALDEQGAGAALVRRLSAEDFPKTAVQVGPDGALSSPAAK